MGLLEARAVYILPNMAPGGEARGDVALDCQQHHTACKAACADQAEGCKVARAQVCDDEEGHEEHQRGAEVVLQGKARAADGGQADEHPQVALVEQPVERGRAREDVADLGKLGGLERQAAQPDPRLGAALTGADQQRDDQHADCGRAHEPAHLLRAGQVAQEKAEHEEQHKPHHNGDQLLGHLVRHGRAGDGERQRTQEKRDGLHLKADAPERAHYDEVAPADQRERQKGQRDGDGRLIARGDDQLHGRQHLEQRQQHERAPHARGTALYAALGHLAALFLDRNGHEHGRDAAEGDRVAVLDDRVFVHRQVVYLDAPLGAEVIYRPRAVVLTDERGVLAGHRGVFQLYVARGRAPDDVFPMRQRQADAVCHAEIAPDLVRVLDLPQRADRAHQDHQRQQREHEADSRRVPCADKRVFRKEPGQCIQKAL